MDFFLGGIIQFGGNFAPKNWATCAGQLESISQNQALYAVLGTTWGGDGRTNYNLPDLRGRVPIGAGRGPGLTEVYEGRKSGHELNQLSIAQMPTHTHAAVFTPTDASSSTLITATVTVNAHAGTGDQNDATGHYWATGAAKIGLSSGNVENGYATTGGTTMASDAVQVAISGGGGGIDGGTVTNKPAGGDLAFSIMQPVLGMNFIIALQGIFPSRN